MAKKADAWKEYKEAAILDMMLDAMPKVRTCLNFIIIFSIIHLCADHVISTGRRMTNLVLNFECLF